ncbi:MAG: hypothetical protein ACPGN3_02955 [Opitutales bacterium]
MINILSYAWFKNFDWKKGVYTVAAFYIAWTFLAHGVQALLVAEKYKPVAAVVLPENLVSFGLIFVGMLDLAVVLMLLLRNSLVVLAYAGCYPFFPMTLTYFATGELEIIGKILILGFAIIAWFMMRLINSGSQAFQESSSAA